MSIPHDRFEEWMRKENFHRAYSCLSYEGTRSSENEFAEVWIDPKTSRMVYAQMTANPVMNKSVYSARMFFNWKPSNPQEYVGFTPKGFIRGVWVWPGQTANQSEFTSLQSILGYGVITTEQYMQSVFSSTNYELMDFSESHVGWENVISEQMNFLRKNGEFLMRWRARPFVVFANTSHKSEDFGFDPRLFIDPYSKVYKNTARILKAIEMPEQMRENCERPYVWGN